MADEIVSAAIEKLWNAIDAHENELIELTQQLVRYPSVLGQEAEIQHFIANHFRSSNLKTDIWDLDESLREVPESGNSGVSFAGRPNVAGVRQGVGGGRSLIMNGHIDVVSPEPVEDWTMDPWAAEIVDNRLYGRGAYDMKSGVAINMMLPRLLNSIGVQLKGDLTIQSVIEEECTGNGALDMSRRYKADAAIVTEPTNGNFMSAHVGVMWFRIKVTGKSAHAAVAPTGVNAISKMVPIIRALEDLDKELNEDHHPAFEGMEHPINLNIGVINAGDWPSTVPGAAELICRVSFFPGKTVQEMRDDVEQAVRHAAQTDSWLQEHMPEISYHGFQTRGSVVSTDEPSIKLLGKWHEQLRGNPLQSYSFTGLTDQRYFNFAGIPAGCYGPSGEGFHAADEWLDIQSLAPTAKVLGATLLEWCGVAENN